MRCYTRLVPSQGRVLQISIRYKHCDTYIRLLFSACLCIKYLSLLNKPLNKYNIFRAVDQSFCIHTSLSTCHVCVCASKTVKVLLTQTLQSKPVHCSALIESCNFVICPLLHSSEVYFWWRSREVTNKDRYLGSKLTLDKHFSIPIVYALARALMSLRSEEMWCLSMKRKQLYYTNFRKSLTSFFRKTACLHRHYMGLRVYMFGLYYQHWVNKPRWSSPICCLNG